MQIALPLVIIIVVIAVLVGGTVLGAARMNRARTAEVREAPEDSLFYDVPEGQDPAMVIAALRTAGYKAISSATRPQRIEVSTHEDRENDREKVREVIAAAPLDPSGTPVEDAAVRFTDE